VNEFRGGVRQCALGLADAHVSGVDEFVQCRLRTDERQTVAWVTAGQRPGVGEELGEAAPDDLFDHFGVDGPTVTVVVQVQPPAGTVILPPACARSDALEMLAAGRGDASATQQVEPGRAVPLARDARGFEPFEQGELAFWREDGRDPQFDVLVLAVVGSVPELVGLAAVEPAAGELGAEEEAAEMVVTPPWCLPGQVAEGVESPGGVGGGAALVDEHGDGGSDRPGFGVVDLEAVVSAVSHEAVAVGRRSSRPPAFTDPSPQAARGAFEEQLAFELRERAEDVAVEAAVGGPGIEAVGD
jgi:hypothetical protein